MTRRDLLKSSGLLLFRPASAMFGPDRNFSRFRGIFPIVQTPYTSSGDVDFHALEKEIAFLNRCGVHGVVWPQRASQYQYLSFRERVEGAERIVSAAKGKKAAVVIGVQASSADIAVKYAQHAAKIRPDAIIALPTRDKGEFNLDELQRYFATIASACNLPLFVQTVGNMDVEFMLKLSHQIPTLRFIKDEAGDPVRRVEDFSKQAPDLQVFTGSHGRTLIDEMMRGVAGNMPASGWADLYVKVWDAWHSGRQAEAFDAFSKALIFVTEAVEYGHPALNYVLHLRGVFPTWNTRGTDFPPLDDRARELLKAAYTFAKPSLTDAA